VLAVLYDTFDNGITPFFSIVKQADHERLPHKLYPFYSNHRPEDAPFLESLGNLAKSNPNFRLIATMTEALRLRCGKCLSHPASTTSEVTNLLDTELKQIGVRYDGKEYTTGVLLPLTL